MEVAGCLYQPQGVVMRLAYATAPASFSFSISLSDRLLKIVAFNRFLPSVLLL